MLTILERFPLWNEDLEVDLSKLLTPGEYTDIMSKGKQTKTTYNQNLQLEFLRSLKNSIYEPNLL